MSYPLSHSLSLSPPPLSLPLSLSLSLSLLLSLSLSLSGPLSLYLSTAPSDYTSTIRQVTFPTSANAVVCVDIPITDDDTTEPDEEFEVVVTPSTPGVTIDEPNTVTIEIEGK